MERMNVVERTSDQYYKGTSTKHGLNTHFELDTNISHFTRGKFSDYVLTLQSQLSLIIGFIQEKGLHFFQLQPIPMLNPWFLYYLMTLLSVTIGQLNVMTINYFVAEYSLSIILKL